MRTLNLSLSVPPPPRPAELRPHRILVADDDETIRCFNAEMLIALGYQVDAAADGAAAWQALQVGTYELLVTDNQMPNLTGLQLLTKIRSARMTIPVILVSGTVLTAELESDSALHLDATLPKPYTCDDFLRTVERVLHARAGYERQSDDCILNQRVATHAA